MPQRSEHSQTVIDFCLEHAFEAPLQRRVKLYRGLAEFCADEQESANLKSLADSLEATDKLCREFAFQFSQKPSPKSKPKTGDGDGHTHNS